MNPKVLGGLAAFGVGIYLLAPGGLGAAGPLLIALACPLSMVFMMRGMAGGRRCETDGGSEGSATAAGPDHSAELTRLQAEVDQLRARVTERQATPDRPESAQAVE